MKNTIPIWSGSLEKTPELGQAIIIWRNSIYSHDRWGDFIPTHDSTRAAQARMQLRAYCNALLDSTTASLHRRAHALLWLLDCDYTEALDAGQIESTDIDAFDRGWSKAIGKSFPHREVINYCRDELCAFI
jgi:hypothetical protein